jgi:hypothetical protein
MSQTVTVGGVVRTIKGPSSHATKGAPKSKRQGANNTEARVRYWASGRLRARKIRNLMKHCKMTLAVATNLWLSTRKTRFKGAVGA